MSSILYDAISTTLTIDWVSAVSSTISFTLSFLLALPIALNREFNSHSAGLRTFPLVSIAACGFTLLALDVTDDPGAQARIIQGIITGIGFVGGGAIIKGSNGTGGTATAAGIWVTGAIGISIALERIEIALLLTLFTLATYVFGSKVKKTVDK